MASATFADDGTYCVVRRAGEWTTTSSGTYTWTGWKLTLAPEGGPPGDKKLIRASA
jgi:hypothetical protein